MTQTELNKIIKEHELWLNDNTKGSRANLRGANLIGADLRRADFSGADLEGANLIGAHLSGANLYVANLNYTKGILSFTGSKHLLIYFKYNDIYYFKIGCMTYTKEHWLANFESIGREQGYSDSEIRLYGSIIKTMSMEQF